MKEPELHEPRAACDDCGEENAARARVWRRLRIGNHEECEDQQRAVFESMQRNRQRIAEADRAGDEEGGPEEEKRERDVAALRSNDDDRAGTHHEKSEEGHAAPLTG